MKDELQMWLRFWSIVALCATVIVLSTIASTTYGTKKYTENGYCTRAMGNDWVKCEILKDVINK